MVFRFKSLGIRRGSAIHTRVANVLVRLADGWQSGSAAARRLAFSKAGTEAPRSVNFACRREFPKKAACETSALNFAKRARSEGTLAPSAPSPTASVSVTQKLMRGFLVLDISGSPLTRHPHRPACPCWGKSLPGTRRETRCRRHRACSWRPTTAARWRCRRCYCLRRSSDGCARALVHP